jgi:hypothetical protein
MSDNPSASRTAQWRGDALFAVVFGTGYFIWERTKGHDVRDAATSALFVSGILLVGSIISSEWRRRR